MLNYANTFILMNREYIDNHVRKFKEMEKTLKLSETRMGEYHIELVLSLTYLPESPHHYGRPSIMKRPFVVSSKTIFNVVFLKANVPLEDEDENKSIIILLYKEEVLANLID